MSRAESNGNVNRAVNALRGSPERESKSFFPSHQPRVHRLPTRLIHVSYGLLWKWASAGSYRRKQMLAKAVKMKHLLLSPLWDCQEFNMTCGKMFLVWSLPFWVFRKRKEILPLLFNNHFLNPHIPSAALVPRSRQFFSLSQSFCHHCFFFP